VSKASRPLSPDPSGPIAGPLGTDPGYVGDAAYVEHRQGLRKRRRTRRVVERREGRALAAGRHVPAAEVGHHVDPGLCRQEGTVADLTGTALGGGVGHGMAVEPDHAHLGG
jgi:hypothetical protein